MTEQHTTNFTNEFNPERDYKLLRDWLSVKVYSSANVIHSIRLRRERTEQSEMYLLFDRYMTAFGLQSAKDLDYLIKTNQYSLPVCKTCSTPITTNIRNTYCSNSCAQLSTDVLKLKSDRCLQTHGVDHHSKRADVRDKMSETHNKKTDSERAVTRTRVIETSRARYGTDSPSQSAAVKQKKTQAYMEQGGTCSFNIPYVKERIHKTNLERYGVDNIFKDKEYIRQKTIEKLGVPSSALLPETQAKRKATCIEKYGTSNPATTVEISDKIKHTKSLVTQVQQDHINQRRDATNIERYGVASPSTLPHFVQQRWETHAEKYHNNFVLLLQQRSIQPQFNKSQYINKTIGQKLSYLCGNCNGVFNTECTSPQQIRCIECAKDYYRSNGEKSVVTWLSSFSLDIQTSVRNIISGELDIVLPNFNLAIEYDGLYYHSDIFKQPNSHLEKTKQCEQQGIQLIHIFEHEWLYKKPIVQSIIMSHLGISQNKVMARKCKIVELSQQQFSAFLDHNHLQGAISCRYRYGLLHDDELVMAVGWSHSRFSKHENELVRCCSLLNTQVTGGLSKLVAHFVRTTDIRNFVSYVDRRYFAGRGYATAGFRLESISQPNYFYWIGSGTEIHSRHKFQKHKLKKVLDQYDPTLSERDNMINNGYHRIYDCGNFKFRYTCD